MIRAAIQEGSRPTLRAVLVAALAVCLCSLALRVAWVSLARVTPISHYAGYDAFACQFAQTGEIGFEGKRAYHPPGYPAFLGTAYLLLGHDYRAAGYVHAVLGALTSGLVVLLAAGCLPRAAAVVAGSLHALSITGLVYTPVLAVENLAVPLFVGVLVLLQPWMKSERGRHLQLGMAGLVAGLLLLTRTAAVFAMPAWVLLAAYHPLERRWRRLPTVTFSLVLVVTLGPWLMRNQRLGLGTTLSTVGGVNLWMGNNSLATNGDWLGDAQFKRRMSEREQETAYRAATLEWIRRWPGRYAALCGVRLGRLIGMTPDEVAAKYLVPTAANDAAVLARHYGGKGRPVAVAAAESAPRLEQQHARNLMRLRRASVPLTLLALALALSRWRRYAYIVAPLLLYWLGLGLTCMNERYRELSNPLVYVLMAALFTDIAGGTRTLAGARRLKAVLAVGLVVGGVLVSKGGLDAGLYSLSSQFAFKAVDLQAAAGGISSHSTARVSASAEPDGLHCAVKSRTAADLGGVYWKAGGEEALRLELGVPQPGRVEELFVDGYDAQGTRVVRWRWGADTMLPLPEQQTRHVLVVGENYAYFQCIESAAPQAAVEYHLLVRSKPKVKAEIILRGVALGARR